MKLLEKVSKPELEMKLIHNVRRKTKTKMERRIVMWVIVGALFLGVLYLAFMTGSTSAAADTVAATKSIASSSGMVGGC